MNYKQIYSVFAENNKAKTSVWLGLLLVYVFILNFDVILAFFTIFPFSILFTIFVSYPQWIKEPKNTFLKFIQNKKFYTSIMMIFTAIIMYTIHIPPKINEWPLIIFGQALLEETFFRFSALGLLKNEIYQRNKVTLKGHLIVLIFALLFSFLHGFFQQELLVFIFRIVFTFITSYLFLELGIVASIVFHMSWNFYMPSPIESLIIVIIGCITYIAIGNVKFWSLLVTWGELGKKHSGEFIGAMIVGFFTFLAFFIANFSMVTFEYTGENPLDALLPLIITTICFITLSLGQTRIHEKLVKKFLKTKFEQPVTVRILSGVINSKNSEQSLSPHFSEWTIQDWETKIKTEKIEVKEINANELKPALSKNYPLVINPFGEIYPEEDVANLRTLKNIKKYVDAGGVFVNVAGFPFFYMRDTREKPRTSGLTGQLAEMYKMTNMNNEEIAIPTIDPRFASLIDTWIYQNFGLRVNVIVRSEEDALIETYPVEDEYFREIANMGGTNKVFEFRSIIRCEDEEIMIIPILKAHVDLPLRHNETETKQSLCYPIAAVKYGKGYFIFIGLQLKKNRQSDFEKAIETIHKTCEKLADVGSL